MLLSVFVLGLGMSQMQAQKNQNVVGKIFNDMKESTQAVHEINKVNLAIVKEEFQTRHAEATEPSESVVNFRQAKGFKNKMNAIAEGFRASSRENAEKERVRREQIQSHESYRRTLLGG